jgi:hypothetical protein
MKTSEKTDILYRAMFGATATIGGVVKDQENDFLKSKYADLPAVMRTYREPVRTAGLMIVQTPYTMMSDAGVALVGVTTRVIHVETGEWLEDSFAVPCKADPQGAGSAITYCRRYALTAIFQIPQVDTDAEAAMFREPEKLTEEQVKTIEDLLEKTRIDFEPFAQYLGCPEVERVADLTANYYDKAFRSLKGREKSMADKAATEE